MWKFKFDAPKGSREYHKGFIGICCYPSKSGATDFCWNHDLNKWVDSQTRVWHSTHADEKVNNFRQFKKYLSKHPELRVEGVEVILCNRYYVRDGITGVFLHDLSIRAYWDKKLSGRNSLC